MEFGLDPNLYTSDGLLKTKLINKCLTDDNKLYCYKYTIYPLLNKVTKSSKIFIIYDKNAYIKTKFLIHKFFNKNKINIKYLKFNDLGIFYNTKFLNKLQVKKMLISGIKVLKYYENIIKKNKNKKDFTLEDINRIIYFNIFQGYNPYLNILLNRYLINYKLSNKEEKRLNNESIDKSGNVNYEKYYNNKLILLKTKEKYIKYKETLRQLYKDIKKKYKKIYE